MPNPKEVDTYVRFEFPYPSVSYTELLLVRKTNHRISKSPVLTQILIFQEAPPRDKTPVIYNTNNPIYEERFTLAIQRNRACQRVFKRHGIKFEIWSKGWVLYTVLYQNLPYEYTLYKRWLVVTTGRRIFRLKKLCGQLIVHHSYVVVRLFHSCHCSVSVNLHSDKNTVHRFKMYLKWVTKFKSCQI